MPSPVYLPKVGMTMEEGTLCRWLVADGSPVTRGQPLFEMETEKVQMEVEAEADGVLHALVAEGTVLKPGAQIAWILAPGEEPPADSRPSGTLPQASRAAPFSVPAPPASSTPSGERVRATPIARRLAAEHGIDLTALKGSGPDGRIVEQDVRNAIAAAAAPAAPAATPVPPPFAAADIIPYEGRRRTIGERMLGSLQSMAQLTLVSEVPLDDALRMLHGLNREWRRDGVVVTLTALAVRACAIALRQHPSFNARLRQGHIELLPRCNVGFAVDLEGGLMVPVVKDADGLPLRQVAQRIKELTERAEAGSLALEDVSDGTFTVTSLEGSAVDAFTPVINPPQAAILGIGRVRETATFEGDSVVRRRVVTLSLSFDHRLNDGAPAARFLGRIAELLDRPYLLM